MRRPSIRVGTAESARGLLVRYRGWTRATDGRSGDNGGKRNSLMGTPHRCQRHTLAIQDGQRSGRWRWRRNKPPSLDEPLEKSPGLLSSALPPVRRGSGAPNLTPNRIAETDE